MRDLRLRCTLLAITAVLLLPFVSPAQGSPAADREVQALRAKLLFVRKLDAKYPVSGFSGTWALLEEDASRLSGEHRDLPDFARVHQDVLLSWGRALAARGEPARALEKYRLLIADYGESAEGFREAAAASAKIHITLAETSGTDAEKLSHLVAARDLYGRLGDARAAEGIRDEIVDLKSREGIRLTAARRYDEAFELLSAVEREEGSLGSGEAAKALRYIRENTGILSVRFVEVEAEGTDITSGAVLRFSPRGSGEKTELPVKSRIRWVTGEYDVSLRLPDREKAVLTVRTRLHADGAGVELPDRVPPGMAYVPAGGRVSRPFFIDQTEVTASAYAAFDPEYRPPRGDSQSYPARGMGWKKAAAYAASRGKKLPTLEQWQRAAFGDTSLKYPWGNGDPRGRCNIGTAGPVGVDAYPNGASPYGVLNLAGNVWEWLRDGYAIGGGYRLGRLESAVPGGNWTADFLRDGKPAPEIYSGLRGAQQRKYGRYRVTDKTQVEVGFRCVIEL